MQTCASDEIGYSPRYQHLVRSGMCHHPRGSVDSDAADVAAPEFYFSGMKARAQGQTDLLSG